MIYLMMLFLVATVAVLIIGLIGYARNSERYQRNANKLMRYRILFQFLTLIFALIVIAMAAAN